MSFYVHGFFRFSESAKVAYKIFAYQNSTYEYSYTMIPQTTSRSIERKIRGASLKFNYSQTCQYRRPLERYKTGFNEQVVFKYK